MKIFKYLAALVYKYIWRKTQKRSDAQKSNSDITVIAVGNGGYNIAYNLIQMGCFDGARFFVCDTKPSDLTRHASNADETFLLDRINGDVKSADTTHVDHIIKKTSQNVILVGAFGGLTGSKYVPLLALEAVMYSRSVYSIVTWPLNDEGPSTIVLANKAMKQLAASSRITVIQNNNILLELKNLTISQINQPITNTLSAILKRYSLEELADNNTIDLQRLIPIKYQVFTENTDDQCTVKNTLLAIINTFRIMPNEERKRIFDS